MAKLEIVMSGVSVEYECEEVDAKRVANTFEAYLSEGVSPRLKMGLTRRGERSGVIVIDFSKVVAVRFGL